jgi:hypothetical protein
VVGLAVGPRVLAVWDVQKVSLFCMKQLQG